jgi:hypothetical protein
MSSLPAALVPLLLSFAPAFTEPTYRRWTVLMLAATLATGRRTISNLLRTVQTLAPGHPASYHRVFSERRWSLWPLSHALAGLILRSWVKAGPVLCAGDDTALEHRGAKVYGKALHRDAVRSSHSYTAFLWGHKWVVLAILVQFPFAARPWALPVLVALYRSKEDNRRLGRRHKTPARLLRQLVAALRHWFPERVFVLAGDGGYSSHEMAWAAGRSRRGRWTLVGKLAPRANLYAPPPQSKNRVGRPRLKGAKLPAPAVVVQGARRQRLTVRWYGGQTREVGIVTGTGWWYKGGGGVVEIRWVFVHDLTGTHRDEYFFSTAPAMKPREIIETYTGRWSIEVTFEELREYLGLATTRGWVERTVLRWTPCLFGLYSGVALLYAHLPRRAQRQGRVLWVGKQETTFSDVLTAVRRWLWREWVFEKAGHGVGLSKFPRRLRALVLYALAPAA